MSKEFKPKDLDKAEKDLTETTNEKGRKEANKKAHQIFGMEPDPDGNHHGVVTLPNPANPSGIIQAHLTPTKIPKVNPQTGDTEMVDHPINIDISATGNGQPLDIAPATGIPTNPNRSITVNEPDQIPGVLRKIGGIDLNPPQQASAPPDPATTQAERIEQERQEQGNNRSAGPRITRPDALFHKNKRFRQILMPPQQFLVD